ncbi:chromosome partitioning protein ParB [Thiohalocapsa marina]|uniref:Chromosome partitioning protein ParB n=1 Tax=Thiohalocapsa marina TaxID=424902 RepID=A0A5M8FPS4_9GAMM|nr:chromosome partitioning protein ParB [Thiohalocapsa marina]KAA6186898.1 chromosome partitioning protein ParB [Thiohalocapsa marina]
MPNTIASAKTLAAGAIVACLALSTTSVSAAECKGMEKSKCEGNASCTWVDGYKRKDGAQVAAYCRNKGGKKSSGGSSSSSSSSTGSSNRSSSG